MTLPVVGRVKRKSQFESHIVISKLTNHLRYSGCGNGNPSRTHGQTIGRGNSFDRTKNVFIIQQRFSHSHEHDVSELSTMHLLALLVEQYHFVVDLVEIEVAFSLDVSSSAEFATKRATDLRGNAGSVPVGCRNQHAFHQVSFVGPEP